MIWILFFLVVAFVFMWATEPDGRGLDPSDYIWPMPAVFAAAVVTVFTYAMYDPVVSFVISIVKL